MPDDFISISVEGLDKAAAQAARLAAQLLDLRTFWPKLVPLFISWVSRTFDTEGGFIGDPWEQLSPDYALWKQQHYPGKRILSAEGDLRKAATSPARVVTSRVLELRIESYDKHGDTLSPSWFQKGTDSMPARPILAEHPSGIMQAEAEAVGEAHARELVRLLGLR